MRSRADVTSIQYENGKRTRTKFLAAVQEGKSLRDAALFAGWMNMQSYYYHRKQYPLWAAEVDLARQGNRPNPTMLVTGLGQGGSYEVIPGPPTTERISSEFQEFVKDNFPDRRPHQKHQLQIVTELHGLRPREVCLFLIWPEAGKGLSLDTPLPTPTGVTHMRHLKAGDTIYAADGTPTRVTFVSPIHERPCYRLSFSGGGSIVADDEHQWVVRSSTPRRTHIANTAELAAITTVNRGTERPNHAVPVIEPLQHPSADLPLDPYLLGVWLGDGSTDGGRITSVDPEIESAFVRAGFEISSRHTITFYVAGLRQTLRKVGVLNKKRIPDEYFAASVEQRWALLEGLMDSDGHCDKLGRCEFTTTKLILFDHMQDLLGDLGVKFSTTVGDATLNGKRISAKYRVNFVPRRQVFRLARKASRQRLPIDNDRDRWRTITSIEHTHTVPTVCIKVEHPSETFIVYDSSFTPIVTHNTSTIEDYICKTLAEDPNHRFRIISEGQDLSKRIVGTCARRFTETNDYPHFQARYGPFYEKGQERQGKPWTTDQITVWKNSGMERDRSLVAQSWSGANYGSRIDTLIIDDVQSQRNYGQSEEIFRRIRGTFFNRGKEMRTLIVGTRIGPDDFYDRMMNAGLITRKVVLPAMRDDGTPYSPDADEAWKNSMVHDGGPCCSGFRVCPNDGSPLSPKEYLEQVRHQVGEESWWASYMQKPSSDQRTTFGALVDRCLDKDRPYGMLPAGVR